MWWSSFLEQDFLAQTLVVWSELLFVRSLFYSSSRSFHSHLFIPFVLPPSLSSPDLLPFSRPSYHDTPAHLSSPPSLRPQLSFTTYP